MGVFSALRDWHERRAVLRDVVRQAADKKEEVRFTVRDALTIALESLDHDDPRRAQEIWAKLKRDYPTDVDSSPLALDLLLRLRHYDEAQELMLRGQKQHPSHAHFPLGLAQIAMSRGNFDEAIERFAAVRKRFPHVLTAYMSASMALRIRNRHGEAEALAILTMKRFDTDAGGYLEYARGAQDRGDWPEAFNRYETAAERSDHVAAHAGAGQALLALGRVDEAEARGIQMRIRFPTSSEPLTLLARAAETRGDIQEAIQRWMILRDRFPGFPPAYVEVAAALLRLNEPVEAEAVLRDAVGRFPDEPEPNLRLALLLHGRGDFVAAAEAWALVRQVAPNKQEGYNQGADALDNTGRSGEAAELRAEARRRFLVSDA